MVDDMLLPASPGDPLVLETMGLHKHFREGSGGILPVLNGVNFSLMKGEKVAIVGASGSGKSTLLHLLGGLDKPSSGRVMIHNRNLATLSEKALCKSRNVNLGFIYQFHHLLPEFTAEENVAMPLLIQGVAPGTALRRSRTLLEKVGLIGRLNHKPGQLSGGERQRAAIARAMITEPRCLLADEPTGNLDAKNAEISLQVMLRLNEEYDTSLVLVTHDHDLAAKMDVVYRLENGILHRH